MKENCSICNNYLTGLYCSSCGQKVTNKKSTPFSIIIDFINSIFSFERSVIGTTYDVITKPSKVVNNYYEGNRLYYLSPGKLFIFSLVIATLHISLVDPRIFGLTIDGIGIANQKAFWIVFYPLFLISSFITYSFLKRQFILNIISVSYTSIVLFYVVIIFSDILMAIFSIQYVDLYLFLTYLILLCILNASALVKTKKTLNILLFALINLSILFLIIAIILVFIYLIFPDYFYFD